MPIEGIKYFEDTDFVNGKLKYPGKYLIFVYGDFCPHCHKVMSTIKKLVDTLGDVEVAAIQIDDNYGGKVLSKKMNELIPGFSGVPTFVGFKDGKLVGIHEDGRDEISLRKFSKQI